MKIIESILTKNDCYKAGRTITVKGLMLHSVGTPQPSAKVFVNNWNRPGLTKCVHGFIDANDGTVYQTLPWNRRGWHGGGSSNNTHIGVEMCEPAQIKYVGGATFTIVGKNDEEKAANKKKAIAAAMTAYDSAVELFAMLCNKYHLNPMTQICSHSEGHKKGIASNHGDCDHLWRQLGMDVSMDTFRKDVKKAMGDAPVIEEEAASSPGSDSGEKKVKVSISNLRIRKGPGTDYPLTGSYTGVGIFTITKIQNGKGSTKGWGHLKSGAGWISLDYAKDV